jgi:hypothetical protein
MIAPYSITFDLQSPACSNSVFMSKKSPIAKVSASSDMVFLLILEKRFADNATRHPGIVWDTVRKRLEHQTSALSTLKKMEETGGEPDVVGLDEKSGKLVFMDCAAESPAGRRSLCFDQLAWDERKENKPAGSAMELAESMGAEMLSEEDYSKLQMLGKFDLKTSSWVQTPQKIRKLGGALFCDRRYDSVFVYHNGAQSYYAARGFRCKLLV